MGSLGGHMMHLWEDRGLSFGDLKEIISQTCSGHLEATEKFDGINIHFRVDSSGDLRFARSGSDQKTGGLTQAQFSKLMENHPAKQTFVDGAESLYRLAKKSFWPLGFSGRNWINCDIINKHRPMTLDYDECAVVFHGVKNFSGAEVSPALHESFIKYASDCSQYSVMINENEWRVCAPVSVNIPDLRGEGILSNFENSIKTLMKASNCNENSKIEDFARFMVYEGVIAPLNLSPSRSEKLLSHIFQDGGTRLVDIKKGLSLSLAKKVSEVGAAKNRNKVIGGSVLPLELIVTYVGAQVLESVSSCMIKNPAQEKSRLLESVEASELVCEVYSDEYSQQRSAMLKKYIEKFNSCGRITPAIEGVVFEHGERQYKLTGNFAPINHILGIPRYGRGKIPPVDSQYDIKDMIEEIDLIKNMSTF